MTIGLQCMLNKTALASNASKSIREDLSNCSARIHDFKESTTDGSFEWNWTIRFVISIF